MSAKSQWTHVDKRKLELTNLNKILFPQNGIIKAEVIAYYLKMAPTILYHIKGRPLTLIRYPDGIIGEHFYQKNRPEWAPDWVEFIRLGDEEKKDYILATERATLVWLANLAALELHQMHSRRPHFDYPDYFVFDLDPPEKKDFGRVVKVALLLKEHLEDFGYCPFVKTSGGKGLHIVVPVEPKWDFQSVFEATKEMAQPFVQKHSNIVTLQIKKNARKGRILVDIYRNRNGQSIVSPYSLRGREGAPVSMPIRWDELASVDHPDQFHLKNAFDQLIEKGDAWEGIGGYATVLHTRRSTQIPVTKSQKTEHVKTPDQLAAYTQKRDFSKSTEPKATVTTVSGHRFVIHRHHASRLHYDLRLEQAGVLKSWAVPKGMPHRPGIKRLAVETEDHPIEYLNFEGTIPKGEYGAGQMWVFATGRYEITKQKTDGMYFRLESADLSGEYRLHRMKDKEWLLEKVEHSQIDWLTDLIQPMLSASSSSIPKNINYIYEVKWDGIRAMIAMEEGQLRIRSRNQNDITRQFPELQISGSAFRADNGLFDGEIVCLDPSGKPQFKQVINRLLSQDESTIQSLSRRNPAYCYLFDCLYLDGRAVVNEPLLRRKEWLNDSLRDGSSFRFSEHFEDGQALFRAAKEHKLEGIMAKKRDSVYMPGKRSDLWLKIKVRRTADCLVVGYTQGQGDRRDYFGALHLAERINGNLQYRGKVGTGFTVVTMKEINEEIKKLKTIKKPVENKIVGENDTTWVKPRLIVEVSYSRLTPDKILREPVFLRLRPDLMD
ncbi:MAG TPA: non-homologous end-joining DNA ligase [Balneolaceae bacterium]|nr:non-homologous end-joining DNA ligase [Balneolaceae bacterium]